MKMRKKEGKKMCKLVLSGISETFSPLPYESCQVYVPALRGTAGNRAAKAREKAK